MICLRIVKTNTAKTPSSNFKVITPKFHYYHSKWLQVKESQHLIPTYSWTHTPIPNWTCSIVNFSFWCTASNTWLSNCADPSTQLQSPTREGCLLQSFSIHPNVEDLEDAWSKTLRCTNIATSSQEWWTRANAVFGHNLHEQTLLNTCATCEHFDSH